MEELKVSSPPFLRTANGRARPKESLDLTCELYLSDHLLGRVAPESIHAAVFKGCHMLDVECRIVSLDKNF